MVRKAEKEMGAPIFDRSTIPLTVTKEGAYYIRTVEKILFLERNLERYFQDIAGLQGGTLALGGASYFCSFVYPDLIARFQTKYPQVTIDLTEGNTRELKAGLEMSRWIWCWRRRWRRTILRSNRYFIPEGKSDSGSSGKFSG